MDMRIEFEAAMAKQLSSEGYSDFSIEMMFERGSDNEYRSIRVNGAYWGWQASRESLVVELPRGFSTDYCNGDAVFDAEEVMFSISKAGAKYK